MKAYLPVGLGTKIQCNCDDDQCWAGIEILPEALSFYRDLSDESQGGIHVELPEGYELCKVVEVKVDEVEQLVGAAVLLTEQVSGLKRVVLDSYGVNGENRKKIVDLERQVQQLEFLNHQHIKELVQLRAKAKP